ncbi:MAG: HAD domain-containing protein [Bacteroidales bacterium]|nr:HAD domain-containing protein [Bacteroidales bacterium]
MSKIIFLDFDGVLNTEDYQHELLEADKPREDNYGRLFSPVAMDNLYRIVRATGAKIVVISSWKGIYGLDGLRQMWKERGYMGEINDVTRNGVSDEWLLNADLSTLDNFNIPHPKSLEISDYLKTHRISNYAIIDDEPIASDEQKSHLFLSNPQTGLTMAMADNVIAYLLSL